MQSRTSSNKARSIVVVLGMHRSGTSAITKGLELLGVELGERLMPPNPDVNKKGFFEDLDINAINIELYKALDGGHDWHTVGMVPRDDLLHERHAPLRLRAIEVLRSRLREMPRFGLKDPRLCRLLPFWQSVFGHLELPASYVITVRNPLSVARSLEKRDQLPAEKCHYLWLEHVVSSLRFTQRAPRVVVDYDRFLDDPAEQLARIAQALGFEGGIDPARLAEFTSAFLEADLRHARFEREDVGEDPSVPTVVREAVALLTGLTADKVSLESKEFARTFDDLSRQMDGLAPAMNYLHRLDIAIAGAEKEAQVAALKRDLQERDERLGVLALRLAERDNELALRDERTRTLENALAEQQAHAASLSQGLNARIGTLVQTLDEREAHAARLAKVLAAQDAQIKAGEAGAAGLFRKLEEREGRIAALNDAVRQRDMIVQRGKVESARLDYLLRRARASLSWRLFWPVRRLRTSLARLWGRSDADLVTFNQLQANGPEWLATGDNPQFLLLAARPWRRMAGWYWLELECIAAQRMNAQLYFDLGQGFLASRVLEFPLFGTGEQRIPLYVAASCDAIRLDLHGAPPRFRLSIRGLVGLRRAPVLPPEFKSQAVLFEALGHQSDSAALDSAGKPLSP